MSVFSALVRVCTALLLAWLAACSRPAPDPSSAGPDAVIRAAVGHLHAGELGQFLALTLPPDELERLRADWAQVRDTSLARAARLAEFHRTLAALKRPDAVDVLMTALEPHLARFERDEAPHLPLALDMARNLLLSGIHGSARLTPAQKQQASAIVDALDAWARRTSFTDRTRLRAALTHLVAGAQASGVGEFDTLRALSFDEALARGGALWLSLSRALAVYGLSIDEALASVRTAVLSRAGNRARVRIVLRFLDQPLSTEIEMVSVDGRWYGQAVLDGFRLPMPDRDPDWTGSKPAAARQRP